MTVRVPLATLVERFGGQCAAPPDREIVGFATLDEATANHLAFVAQPRFRAGVPDSRAAAVLVTAKDAAALASSADRLWVCKDPYLQFARIAQWFDAANREGDAPGVHPTAVVDPGAVVAEGAVVGPHAVIGPRARIEAGARIGAGCFVGADSRIGDATRLHPHVTIYHGCTVGARCIVHSGAIVGADGFGFAKDGARWEKIPQTGGVVIGDDVEIGANTTIDRGALSDTVIGRGVKLDNQIQVAHNVRIGDDTIMAAFVGIAGSAVIGARCMIGGAARIMGHVTIADDVVVSTQTFVSRSIAKPGQYTGYYPMSEHASFEKNAAVLRRLDQLRDRVRSLETGARHSKEPPEPEGPA